MTSSVAERDGHVADFLAMLSAERGASTNTIGAYAADLVGFLRPTRPQATFRPISAFWRTRDRLRHRAHGGSRRSNSIIGSCWPKI